jgi:hypothetical protein
MSGCMGALCVINMRGVAQTLGHEVGLVFPAADRKILRP